MDGRNNKSAMTKRHGMVHDRLSSLRDEAITESSPQQPPDWCLIVSPPSEPYNIIINTTAEEQAPCLVLWLLYSYSPVQWLFEWLSS